MNNRILVTGSAGFIGFHLCRSLLNDDFEVLGIDNLNDYYSVQLKRDRLAQLTPHPGFTFAQVDIADAAEEVVAPAMPAECLLDRNALIMGYSGVYSSFLKHAIRQSERYGVPAHKLLHRAGQRKLIGGQEDQLIDIALEIKREMDAST